SNGSSDSSACSPKKVGFVQSSPLSIVTRATSPARVSLNSVTDIVVPRRGNLPVPPSPLPWSAGADRRLHRLPEQGRTHAHPDAQRGQAVTNIGSLAESVGELRHQAHTGRR